MKLRSVLFAAAFVSSGFHPWSPAFAQSAPAAATIVVSSLPITLFNANTTLSRVIYSENFSVKADLTGNQPFNVAVPVDQLSTIDPDRHQQRIVAYSGTLNDGIQLQIRPIHAGGTYQINIYVGSIPAALRLAAINKICDRVPSANDIDAQETRYFVCRRIVIDTGSEDVVTFKALKGWWEANYVLSTARDAYIAPDPDVLDRVEEQLNEAPISDRFKRVFDVANLRREILEVKSRSLADYGSVRSFINSGDLANARLVYDAALTTFNDLSTQYSVSVIDGISRSRLETDGQLLEGLEGRTVPPP